MDDHCVRGRGASDVWSGISALVWSDTNRKQQSTEEELGKRKGKLIKTVAKLLFFNSASAGCHVRSGPLVCSVLACPTMIACTTRITLGSGYCVRQRVRRVLRSGHNIVVRRQQAR